jgi:hypothetical protein
LGTTSAPADETSPSRDQACSLQIHGYTARRDPKATYSSPSAAGLMMAVGNVGEELAGYTSVRSRPVRELGKMLTPA